MSDTINNGIPFVPENTIDPAAGLNEALLIIDRLLQLKVLGMKVNTPAVGPAAGDRYIVGTSPTGDWVGEELQVAEWMPDGYWSFSPASVSVYGTSIYINTGTDWVPASAGAGASWGGITGSLGDQADLAAALAGKESELIAGANITIDRSDPEAPVISSSGGGGGGEANTASNLGAGEGLYSSKVGVDLRFKSLVAGTNVSLSSDGDTVTIDATGGGGGSGTVTSVALSAPTGFDVSGSPVTASGTLALSFSTGYSLPTNANQANWSAAFGWGDHALAGYEKQLTAGANITIDRTDPDNPIISSTASGGGGGGSAEWGDITGDISDQVDLASALSEKEYELTAGSNITIDRTNPLAPVISSTGGGGGSVEFVNVWEYENLITSRPDALDPSTWDWTPAIQGAISAAETLGVYVYLPPGNYLCGEITMLPAVGIKGAGQVSTILRARENDIQLLSYLATDSIKVAFSVSSIGFSANGKSGCTAIKLDGNSSAIRISRVNLEDIGITGEFAQGIALKFCANTTVKDLFTSSVIDALVINQCADTDVLGAKLQNGAGYGVFINGGAGAFDEGVRLVGVSTNGQAFGLGINGQDWGCATACSFTTAASGALVMTSSTNWKFTACEFAPAAGATSAAAALSATCSDHIFTGCHFILGSFGLALQGERHTVIGCGFKSNSNTDLYINSSKSTFMGNYCDSPNTSSIIEAATANFNVISGNVSNGTQTKAGAQSILVNSVVY